LNQTGEFIRKELLRSDFKLKDCIPDVQGKEEFSNLMRSILKWRPEEWPTAELLVHPWFEPVEVEEEVIDV